MAEVEARSVMEVLEFLGLYLQRPVPSGQGATPFLFAFQRVNHDDFLEGVQAWCRAHGPSSAFPSATELARSVETVRRLRWEKAKKASPTWQNLERHASSFSKGSQQLLRLTSAMLRSSIAHREYFEQVAGLEEQFPNEGFFELGRSMQRAHADQDCVRSECRVSA